MNREINVVIASQERLEAITEMAKAIHQLALALSASLVTASDNVFNASKDKPGLSMNLKTPED